MRIQKKGSIAICCGIVILLLTSFMGNTGEFKEKQKRYSRVRKAFDLKYDKIQKMIKDKGLKEESLQLFIRAFKKEKQLEVWGSDATSSTYKLLVTYPFCALSGELGPKRKQGDYQVPEGVYFIDRFNPASNFHLSLGINYPNTSDKIRGYKKALGGDIFIHGDCVTIGCIPLTDDKIRELYLLSILAKDGGQSKIAVHIFPFKLNNVAEKHKTSKHLVLWKELETVFLQFEKSKKIPSIWIDKYGKYQIKN